MTDAAPDNGARELAERLMLLNDHILIVDQPLADFADAILANGARFVADPLSVSEARREVEALTVDELVEWLRRADNRLEDIFGLWVQGKRDDRWVAEKLIGEGHLAAILDRPAPPDAEIERLRRIEAAAADVIKFRDRIAYRDMPEMAALRAALAERP
jgi:hypothetical protein